MTRHRKTRDPSDHLIVGVDGEGHDVPCEDCEGCAAGAECLGPQHIYTYLAAVDENGRTITEAYSAAGLTHEECVAALLRIPKEALAFAYMFSYDATKIVEDLPLADVYYLMRPQLRDETICASCRRPLDPESVACRTPGCDGTETTSSTRPVRARGRRYDFFNGSMTIRDGKRATKVWDCFRFFGGPFVDAIKDWKVGTAEQHEQIADMKAKRGSFADEDPEDVRRYCREECHLLAMMMRKVIGAHAAAEIPLKDFYGAGSTASALLKHHDVGTFRGPRLEELDPALALAIRRAFAGGRFENSTIGVVERPTFGFDISSAYPFALSFLPCLACGVWRRLENATPEDLDGADLALAAFRVRSVSSRARREISWCPLPFRDEKGSIAYGTNFVGWSWWPELSAALRGWPDLVELRGEAWIYTSACEHRPFGFLPKVYRRRCELGKDGPGIVMKLGSNASYGKTAQAIGDDPPFQSWPWAGACTATCRGMLLDAIATARDPWSVLAVATDGIYATEDLDLGASTDGTEEAWRCHAPRDTMTFDLPKPLGGWERKPVPEGIFVAKPGLYWRLRPSRKEVRARGLGRREAFDAHVRIQDGFLMWDRTPDCSCEACRARGDGDHHVSIVSRRFYGAKHAILARSRCGSCDRSWPGVPEQFPGLDCPSCGRALDLATSLQKDANGRPAYGRWAPREIRVAFDPHPKREREGLSRRGTFVRLSVRDLGGAESAPYDTGGRKTTPQGEEARAAREIMMEQPDYDPGLREFAFIDPEG